MECDWGRENCGKWEIDRGEGEISREECKNCEFEGEGKFVESEKNIWIFRLGTQKSLNLHIKSTNLRDNRIKWTQFSNLNNYLMKLNP